MTIEIVLAVILAAAMLAGLFLGAPLWTLVVAAGIAVYLGVPWWIAGLILWAASDLAGARAYWKLRRSNQSLLDENERIWGDVLALRSELSAVPVLRRETQKA